MTRHEDQRWADDIRLRNQRAAERVQDVRAAVALKLPPLGSPGWTPRPKTDPHAIAFDIQHFKAVHGVSLPDHAHEWLQEMADRCWNLPSVWARVGLALCVGLACGYLVGVVL